MRPQIFALALTGVFLPAGAVLADSSQEKLPKLECLGPASMDPYYISFDLAGRKAYVQRHLEIAPREGFPIDVLSDESIEWTGVMRFKFDRRANLLHETAVFTTDDYHCTPMKAENP